MKNIKILLVLIIALCPAVSHGQTEKTTMERLRERNWFHTYPISINEVIESKWIFTTKKFTEVATYQNRSRRVVFSYYLSDRIETSFDESKLGRVNHGRYFITRNKFGEVFIKEIISLSEDRFEFGLIDPETGTRRENDRSTLYKATP